MRILEAEALLADAGASVIPEGAVAVGEGRVLAIGPAADLARQFPQAPRERFERALLLPGFVNAHQHGRGLSQIQLGYPDDALEPWIARRRGRGAPDPYALTKLAALEMLANGVTATLHANYSYASGDYEAELRASLRAYEETGLHATVCVGYADRGGLVYPDADEDAFRAGLSAQARALLDAARPAYLPLDATLDLMDRLCADYAGHPTITLAYGPAGPQWVSDAAWAALAKDAAARGLGLHFHLLESPAQARCAGALYPEGVLARLEALGVFAARVSAAHFTRGTARDIAQALRLGLVIVANPGSNLRLGNGAPAMAHWREAGLTVALGTDNCALQDDEDYLSELRLGDLLARAAGADPAATLAMGTQAGARACFRDDIGSLRPGLRADLVALDLSRLRGAYLDTDTGLVEAVMARACGADVVMTMVEGEERYRRGPAAADIRRGAADLAASAAFAARDIGAPARRAAEEIAQALRRHYGHGS
ncbi:amidohydrolase family protein [Ancylobacter sp. A5.8]|uniref:amidohydrolase family protein n=1 Tax=Ancylobacter gelatini TaxID=2919920 RepID=UPI001F4E0D40|nr:amidohydrolase family protein [Ancylobacter gelatini]MCJ8143952.1 amidohydrolase family protein [Ancylobacter gelatini]